MCLLLQGLSPLEDSIVECLEIQTSEDGEELVVAFYEARITEVIVAVSEDRLLIFQVKQG